MKKNFKKFIAFCKSTIKILKFGVVVFLLIFYLSSRLHRNVMLQSIHINVVKTIASSKYVFYTASIGNSEEVFKISKPLLLSHLGVRRVNISSKRKLKEVENSLWWVHNFYWYLPIINEREN